MKRAHPVLSPFGLGFALILLISLGVTYWRQGGLLFNPGDLTAQSQPGNTIQGFESHADFETECQRCHAPLSSIQGQLCLECHTNIENEIEAQVDTHGQFELVTQCFACHSDHQGRDFNPTLAALEQFDHNLTAFNLRWHQVDYSANPISCEACHITEGRFETSLDGCIDCHRDYDSQFMTEHQRTFGPGCLDCHDGQDRMTGFDHAQTALPLTGEHANIACADCHSEGQFAGTPARCEACHVEPDIHKGLFSSECADCHTPEGWAAVIWEGNPFDHFVQSNFSLELHLRDYANQPISCQVCHFSFSASDHQLQFTAGACVDCHQQADAIFMIEHQQQFGSDCLACHDGTGRLANFNHDLFFILDGKHAEAVCESCHIDKVFDGTPTECSACHTEPDIHAGLFGLQCQNCHSTQGWIPAALTSHTFPLDHGEQGPVACETCHPTSYVAYTCYDCHEHQPAEIENEHFEEGISRAELANCASCHPNGLKDEAEDN